MELALKVYTAARARWGELTSPDTEDRGDSPVSTAVIVGALAAAAITVGAIIAGKAVDWANAIP